MHSPLPPIPARYSARSFINLSATLVHLKPGDRYPFSATIHVPAGAANGGLYAAILIDPVQAQGSVAGAGVTTAMLVPVMLTLPGPA